MRATKAARDSEESLKSTENGRKQNLQHPSFLQSMRAFKAARNSEESF